MKFQVDPKKPSDKDLEEYLTWTLSQDAVHNPALDTSGERVARNQGHYGNTWFLPGGIDHHGIIKRTCSVPAGVPFLIMNATSDACYLEHPNAKNDGHLLEIAKAVAALHTKVGITITDDTGATLSFEKPDGKSQPKNSLQLIEAPAFPIILPENHIYKAYYGFPGGYTRMAACAWGIKVVFSEGTYTVKFEAEHQLRNLTVGGYTFDAKPFELNIEYT